MINTGYSKFCQHSQVLKSDIVLVWYALKINISLILATILNGY